MKASVIFSLITFLVFSTSCGSGGSQKENNSEKNDTVTTAILEENSADEGFVSIFDGKSTTGWRGYNNPAFPAKGWEVVDGTLHCIASGTGEAGGGGDIIFDRKHGDFELKLEWKISEGGNSGIFILGQEVEGHPLWHSAPEMQILDNEKHPDAKLGKNGNRMAGSLYDILPANPQNAKPVGEWNEVKILVYQGTVVFTQNGENVVEFHLWTDEWKKMVANSKFKEYEWFMNPAKEGYIGLQDHGNDVWFRNIKVKDL